MLLTFYSESEVVFQYGQIFYGQASWLGQKMWPKIVKFSMNDNQSSLPLKLRIKYFRLDHAIGRGSNQKVIGMKKIFLEMNKFWICNKHASANL